MAKTITINDKQLKCLICGNDQFNESGIKLNSTTAVFLEIEWLAKGGKAYICDRCGFNHEFFK